MSLRADSELPQASPAAAFAPAEKLDRIFDILAERALQETGATSVAIGLMRDGGVTCRATAGLPITEVGDPINSETGLTGLAIRRQMSQWCNDTESDARVDLGACRRFGIRSIIVAPVCDRDVVIGVFAIFSVNPDAFSLADLNGVKALAHQITDAIEETIGNPPPPTGLIASTALEHSHDQQPLLFHSQRARKTNIRNYAAKIWRAVARVLPGEQNGRTG